MSLPDLKMAVLRVEQHLMNKQAELLDASKTVEQLANLIDVTRLPATLQGGIYRCEERMKEHRDKLTGSIIDFPTRPGGETAGVVST